MLEKSDKLWISASWIKGYKSIIFDHYFAKSFEKEPSLPKINVNNIFYLGEAIVDSLCVKIMEEQSSSLDIEKLKILLADSQIYNYYLINKKAFGAEVEEINKKLSSSKNNQYDSLPFSTSKLMNYIKSRLKTPPTFKEEVKTIFSDFMILFLYSTVKNILSITSLAKGKSISPKFVSGELAFIAEQYCVKFTPAEPEKKTKSKGGKNNKESKKDPSKKN